MKKVVVLVLMLLYSLPVVAEDSFTDIGSITVADKKTMAVGTAVDNIDREQIDSLQNETVTDVIERLPSAQVTTGSRGEDMIQLRGFDQKEILVLIDGVPSAIPYNGEVDLGKFPISMIQDIEVIKGAGTVAYGPGGLGGAINLVTRSPEKTPRFELEVDGAPVHDIKTSLLTSRKINKFGYAFYGGYRYQSDFPLSGDYTTTANQPKGDRIGTNKEYGFGGGKIEIEITKNHLLYLTGNVVGGKYDVPPSTTSSRPRYWRFDPWMASTLSASHQGKYFSEKLKIQETLFLSSFDNTLKSYDDSGYNTQIGRRTFTSKHGDLVAGSFVKARYDVEPTWMKEISFLLWAGGRFESHDESTVGSTDTAKYSHWLMTVAPQINWSFTDKIELKTGAQIDAEFPERFPGLIEADDDFIAGPFVSLAIFPNDWISIEGSTARRARFPSLKERFADAFGLRVPNPNLGPERAWHFALDLTLNLPKGFTIRLGGFDSEAEDMIVREDVGGGLYQLQNASRARLAGFEGDVEWRYPDWGLIVRGGYQYLYAKRLHLSHPQNQLEYRPEQKANFFIKWNPIKKIFISSDLVVTSSRPFIDFDTNNWSRLPTKARWDLKVEGKVLKYVDLWVSATNVLDSDNMSEYGYPEPGRMIWAGLRGRY